MLMINLAEANEVPGDLIMNEEEMMLYVSSFMASGFTSNINWYRNLDRNWHLIEYRSLNLYGKYFKIQLKIFKYFKYLPRKTNQPRYLKDFVRNQCHQTLDI